MDTDADPTLPVEVYLTNEQVQRIAALSLDSLSGVQVRSDESCNTYALVCHVDIDDPSRTKHFTVYTDGSYRNNT